MFLCVSVCVYVYGITKKNVSTNLKHEHCPVYGNSLNEFDIGHCPFKVKATARL